MELLATIERNSTLVWVSIPGKRMSFKAPLDNIELAERLLGAVNVFTYGNRDVQLTCKNTQDVWDIEDFEMNNIVYIVMLAHIVDEPTTSTSQDHTASSSPTPHPTLNSHCLPEEECETL